MALFPPRFPGACHFSGGRSPPRQRKRLGTPSLRPLPRGGKLDPVSRGVKPSISGSPLYSIPLVYQLFSCIQALAPEAIRLSRRRCTEEGMRKASRYFATVRRAMSIPSPLSRSTILSSDNTSLAGSASIISRIRWRTASDECESPALVAAIAEVKKYLGSNRPRLVAMYLLAVTRLTVDSCVEIASATVLRFSGRK